MARSIVIALVVAVVVPALAADHPVAGTKLILKRAGGREQLVFQSKDPTFPFPLLGTPDVPTMAGAVVEIFSGSEPAGVAFTAPAVVGTPGWSYHDGVADTYRFKNAQAPSGISALKTASLREGKGFKVAGKLAGLSLAAPAGFVSVRITMGSLRSCARFDPATVRTDVPGLFRARGALAGALTDCADDTLTGGGATTTTSTTIAGVCGDGTIDQPSEGCDGADVGGCAGPLPGIQYSCRPPGVANACTCCGNGGIGTGAYGCCNPSAVLIPIGIYENADCVATRCDPPFPCSGTDTCQPDGSCCTSLGATCNASFPPNYYFNPCCPGLECAGVGDFGATCCVSNGGACGDAGDCCSGNCDTGSCTP